MGEFERRYWGRWLVALRSMRLVRWVMVANLLVVVGGPFVQARTQDGPGSMVLEGRSTRSWRTEWHYGGRSPSEWQALLWSNPLRDTRRRLWRAREWEDDLPTLDPALAQFVYEAVLDQAWEGESVEDFVFRGGCIAGLADRFRLAVGSRSFRATWTESDGADSDTARGVRGSRGPAGASASGCGRWVSPIDVWGSPREDTPATRKCRAIALMAREPSRPSVDLRSGGEPLYSSPERLVQ